jgi:arylsulfatase A-like enzyme
MRMWAALLAAVVLGGSPVADEAPARPDIVFVLADDLGPGDLSGFGGEVGLTPRLDRMAADGVRFTRYYSASPICSPSRCGLITGQFPARWRITSYLQTRAGNAACGQADFLDPSAPSLPRLLRDAGYATAHVGKWHLGGGRDVESPLKFAAYGYDLGLGTWESPEPAPALTARDWIWSAVDPVKRWERTGWMVDQTLAFLDAHADRPAFVNLWLDDTHTPWVPTPEDQEAKPDGRATGKGDTPKRLRGVVERMDGDLGRLLDGVKARAEARKRPALVVFASDNGPLPTFQARRTTGLRGSKLSLYEGGIRLPMIAWSTDRALVPAGKTNDTTVFGAVDWLPTLAALAGAVPGATDGENLEAALRGEVPLRTRPLMWEYGRNETSFAYPSIARDRSPNLAIRDGKWKLLVNADGTGVELYDVEADPNETVDRSKENGDLVSRLGEAVRAWRQSCP